MIEESSCHWNYMDVLDCHYTGNLDCIYNDPEVNVDFVLIDPCCCKKKGEDYQSDSP